MCRFVKRKANEQWLWLARDKPTRQMIAFHVGDRSRQSARQLWANLPAGYREQATCDTDQDVVYQGVIPVARHQAITKEVRKTNPIERSPIRYASAFLGWYVRHWPFPRSWRIISVRSTTSSALTT
jgi:IS1 family transposase